MTDEELMSILIQAEASTPASAWEKILSRTRDEWVGDANWECKSENMELIDAFLQRAFSDVPSPPPLDYVDALTSNYRLAIAGAPDAEDKGIRAYEQCYRKMLEAIVESIHMNVVPFASTPDTDVEVADVEAEAQRFQDSVIAPRFLR